MNTFAANLRMSCVTLPTGERWSGQCLCIFLHPLCGLCSMSAASILEVPPCLLPEGHDSDKDLGMDVLDLPGVDWAHPFMVELRAKCIQDWLSFLPKLRKELDLSGDQLRAMLTEVSDALPF